MNYNPAANSGRKNRYKTGMKSVCGIIPKATCCNQSELISPNFSSQRLLFVTFYYFLLPFFEFHQTSRGSKALKTNQCRQKPNDLLASPQAAGTPLGWLVEGKRGLRAIECQRAVSGLNVPKHLAKIEYRSISNRAKLYMLRHHVSITNMEIDGD